MLNDSLALGTESCRLPWPAVPLVHVRLWSKHKSPAVKAGLLAFWLCFQSPISNSPPRNTVVLDTQERLVIENNDGALLIVGTLF